VLKVAMACKAFEHEPTRTLFRIKRASQPHCVWPAPSPCNVSRATPAQTSALMPHPPPAPRRHRRLGHCAPPPAPGAAPAAAAGQSGPTCSALVRRRPARPHGALFCGRRLGSAGLRRGTCIALHLLAGTVHTSHSFSLFEVLYASNSLYQASKPLKVTKLHPCGSHSACLWALCKTLPACLPIARGPLHTLTSTYNRPGSSCLYAC